MSRFLKIAVVFLIVFALVWLFYFVERDSSEPVLRQRIGVAASATHETVEVEIQRSRRMESSITSDVRDALTLRLGTETRFTLPFAERGSVEVATAFCMSSNVSEAAPPEGQVAYEVWFVSGTRRETLAAGRLDLRDARRAWQPVRVHVDVAATTAASVEFVTTWVPAAGAARALDAWRACWSVPQFGAERPAGPNVLVLSIDTLRADRLGCYGYGRKTSPAIDALVARGVLFEDAISAAPWTLPSYASLFTGLFPASHRAGVVTGREALWGTDELAQGKAQRVAETLRKDVPTLAGLLAHAGWCTAAFYNNDFLNPVRGVDRGFAEYTAYQYNAAAGVDLADRWIADHARTRWFLFLHLIDPHGPYAPPAPYDERFAGRSVESIPHWPPTLDALRKDGADEATRKLISDLYDGEVAFADAQIARLLQSLEASGELARTLIVFHSDHGEEFWDHGGFEHGHTLQQELVHVPLAIVFPPRVRAATRIAPRVASVDVLPTLLELLGLPVPPDLDGRSLVPLIDGSTSAPHDCISEGILWGTREMKARFSGSAKLIAAGRHDDQLFDLATDPGERTNLALDRAEEVRTLRAFLAERQRRTQTIPPAGPVGEMTDDARQRLKNLGYTGD